MDQADGLRFLMNRKDRVDNVKAVQAELQKAIIAGKYDNVGTLMALLEQAQIELEAIYLP
ncbi:hypothetical protein [Photobacterium sp.]|uniref:hypothetical protein n=1 Tax=Photobacterium sp. TaxID=660 RepID=UPI00299D664A|nr:hypothetical protein [Photobacterium sp.]MDX1304513.1 hypothetical protein [Photobacterium sp.]